MTEPPLYSFSFCRSDWERIVQSLRDTAWSYTQDSERAHTKGAQDYATLLWEETAILNSIAETVDWGLPE